MRKIGTSFMAVVLMSITSAAVAQPPRGQGGRGAGPAMASTLEIVEKLELSEEQTKAWEAIQTELKTSTAANHARMRELREQEARPDTEEVEKIRGEMRTAFAKAESDLMAILDDQQKEKFSELKKAVAGERGSGHRGRRGGRRGGGGSGGGAN